MDPDHELHIYEFVLLSLNIKLWVYYYCRHYHVRKNIDDSGKMIGYDEDLFEERLLVDHRRTHGKKIRMKRKILARAIWGIEFFI